jgi:hypothetical protein
VARVLTPLHSVVRRAHRSAGLALAGAGGLLLALRWTGTDTGVAQMAGAALTTALTLLCGSQLVQALRSWRQARREAWLFTGLAHNLPQSWYLLGDLQLPAMAGERLPVWAVAITPGGLVVIHLCSEEGVFFPSGAVWVVERGRTARAIPSPTQQCSRAAGALREVLCLPVNVPIWPLVVLTDPGGVYHPAGRDALVIGAPHLPGAVLRCGRASVIPPREALRLAADLARYRV